MGAGGHIDLLLLSLRLFGRHLCHYNIAQLAEGTDSTPAPARADQTVSRDDSCGKQAAAAVPTLVRGVNSCAATPRPFYPPHYVRVRLPFRQISRDEIQLKLHCSFFFFFCLLHCPCQCIRV